MAVDIDHTLFRFRNRLFFNLLKRDFEVFVGVGEVLVESCIQHSFAVWQ
jgi:hypothetical protein